jgi:hypothetical protein
LATQLNTDSQTGTIRFADGKSMEVPLVSAAAAYQAIDKRPEGTGKATLEVISAQAGLTPLQTSRGLAQVPAWRFTIKGIEHPVVRVAVSPEAIKPVPALDLEPMQPRDYLRTVQYLTAVSGTTIEFGLGVGACDQGVEALVWESPDIVVIGGHIGQPPTGGVCTDQLVIHPARVALESPIGERMILDISGSPASRSSQ